MGGPIRAGASDTRARDAALPAALARSPRLSGWLDFGTPGVVTVRTGKVEFGQGITTALAQIAADELDVALERVRIQTATTAGGPDEGLTSGSRSVQESGTAIRLVCAAARSMLVRAAAGAEFETGSLRIEDGRIVDAAGGLVGTYWQLADTGVLDVDVSASVAVKRHDDYRVVGASVPRLDLPDKLAGRPRFIHDIVLPGVLHGRVVRPPSPGAVLAGIDPAAAELDGVDAVVRDGRFLGVVAEREDVADRARARLAAAADWHEHESLPAESDLPAFLRSQPAETTVIDRAAEPAARAAAVRWLTASYSRPYLAHASIAPSCGVARWDGDEVVVWSHSQGIFRLRSAIAAALGIDEHLVTVHHAESAGCYGHNGADDAAFDAVLLARAVPGRPVKVRWSRADELGWAPFGPAMSIELSAGLDAHGRVISWRHEVWSGGHTSRPGYAGSPGLLAAAHVEDGEALPPAADPPHPPGGLARGSVPLYRFRDCTVMAHRVLSMPLRTSALRSLGTHANVFAAESFIDEIAAEAGMDPVEFRLSYLADERARAAVAAVAARSGWTEWPGAEGHGHGIGFARYQSGAYCAVVAEVEVDHRVRVRKLTAAVDVGAVVNPDGVINQIEGGAVQATSWTVAERVRFDRTRITSTSWETYPILRFSEVPTLDVELIDRPDRPSVGSGEAVAGPAAAAIGNAVADALGVRVRDLPLSPESIVAAIDRLS
jgi:nicotinate dehydrogenase subunit B